MDHRCSTVERKLARLAGGGHGIVTRHELLSAGITVEEIVGRVRKGTLMPEYPGVYRVGHGAPSLRARYMAAVKAGGEAALLSGQAGAYLVGVIKGRRPPAEITAPTYRRIRGVRTRRSPDIVQNDAWIYDGIPVTTVPRTLVDLAGVLSLDALARACHEAGVRYRTTPRQVEVVLARRSNTPGAGTLRRVMRGEVHVTLSKLEARFLALLKKHGLPLPRTNRPAGGRRVDCRWPEHRLTVELDSYTYHGSRWAWEQDRQREREAYARGDDFRRYTWSDVLNESPLMLRELRALLSRSERGRGS